MQRPVDRKLTATGASWAVATPHRLASEAAAEVMERGGNAVDGALAAAAVLTVVYPNQTSLGGDLLALVGNADRPVQFVNASGAAAEAVDVDAVLREHGGELPVQGAGSVTVPGVVSGWETLARSWSRLGIDQWQASVRRAGELAREGFAVSAGLARDLQREQQRLSRDAGMRAVFFRDGEVLAENAMLRQPALAASLEQLGSDGASAMYAGEVGRHLLAFLRQQGSALSAQDFLDHEVELDVAQSTTFAGEDYLSAAGNSQGIFFLSALAALEVLREDGPIDPLGPDAGVVAAVLARAAADRDRLSADARFAEVPVGRLLSREYAVEGAERARHGAARVGAARVGAAGVGGHRTRASGDTVAIVAADAEGNWISLIQSVFHCFGAGILDPATGIVLHNRGASFSPSPSSPNFLAGRKRPLHTLMPVLVRRGGRLVGAHGVMGGRAQPQVQAHLALGVAAGSTPIDAVSAPRWVLGALDEAGLESPDSVRAEPEVPGAAVDAMSGRGLQVQRLPADSDEVGHAQVVRRYGETLVAAADPRADGAALADRSGADMVTG